MTSYNPPNLPDPGEGRWWDITQTDWYFTLSLMTNGEGSYRNFETVLVSEDIRVERTDEFVLRKLANTLLDNYDKTAAFVGQYHKN